MRAPALLFLLLLAPGGLAQIYSWRDADGRMHYSDQAPTGIAQPSKLEPATLWVEEADKAKRKLAKEVMDARKRQLDAEEEAAKADKSKGEAAERQENCRLARDYLQTLESGARISRSDEKGGRAYLDDQAREQEIASARRATASWCGSSGN